MVVEGLTVVTLLRCRCCCVDLRDAHFLPRPWPRCEGEARLLWPSPLLGSRCWVSLRWVCSVCRTEIKNKEEIDGCGGEGERGGRGGGLGGGKGEAEMEVEEEEDCIVLGNLKLFNEFSEWRCQFVKPPTGHPQHNYYPPCVMRARVNQSI